MVRRRLKIQGFIVSDHLSLYSEYLRKAMTWVREGQLVSLETTSRGFESLPQAFLSLFRGGNVGKMVVEVGAP